MRRRVRFRASGLSPASATDCGISTNSTTSSSPVPGRYPAVVAAGSGPAPSGGGQRGESHTGSVIVRARSCGAAVAASLAVLPGRSIIPRPPRVRFVDQVNDAPGLRPVNPFLGRACLRRDAAVQRRPTTASMSQRQVLNAMKFWRTPRAGRSRPPRGEAWCRAGGSRTAAAPGSRRRPRGSPVPRPPAAPRPPP